MLVSLSIILYDRHVDRHHVTFLSLNSKWPLVVFMQLVSQQEDTCECTLWLAGHLELLHTGRLIYDSTCSLHRPLSVILFSLRLNILLLKVYSIFS